MHLKNQVFYPCLFMKNGTICVVSVDNTAGANGEELEKRIPSLREQSNKVIHSFKLQNEGEVGISYESGVLMSYISHSKFYRKNDLSRSLANANRINNLILG